MNAPVPNLGAHIVAWLVAVGEKTVEESHILGIFC